MLKHSYPNATPTSNIFAASDDAAVFLPTHEALNSSIAHRTIVNPASRIENSSRNVHTGGYVNSITLSNVTTSTLGNYASLAPGQNTAPGVGTTSNAVPDANEEELEQLFRELQASMDSTYAEAVLQNILEAIEERTLCNFDPLFRDTFLESRIRDALIELIIVGSETSLLLALQLMEGLLPISYTHPQQKFTRLCRSLMSMMECDFPQVSAEAQKLYKRMLQLDMQFEEPPLLNFVPKDLRDRSEHALMQLDGRLQQTNMRSQFKYVSILLAGAATIEVNPQYVGSQLRSQLMMLSMVLSSFSDPTLRATSYDCLCVIFRNTGHIRRDEVSMETRYIFDHAMQVLSNSHSEVSSIISTLTRLRALLSSREISSIHRQVMLQLCVLITEQYHITKSAAVQLEVCKLVPIIAPIDLQNAQRRSGYCAIIMKPVKNIRDESAKSDELHNVAAFIENAGYGVLDSANRINIESIVYRYISRAETQEACWRIIAAICQSNAKQASLQNSITKSQTQMTHVHSTNTLISEMPSSSFPVVDSSVEGPNCARLTVVNNKMHNPVTAETSCSLIQSSSGVSAYQKITAPVKIATESTTSRSHHPSAQSLPSLARRPSIQNSLGAYPVDGNTTSMSNTMEMIHRCVQYIAGAALTENLVRYLAIIQKYTPSLGDQIGRTLDKLVDSTLQNFAKNRVEPDRARRLTLKAETVSALDSQSAGPTNGKNDFTHTSPSLMSSSSQYLGSSPNGGEGGFLRDNTSTPALKKDQTQQDFSSLTKNPSSTTLQCSRTEKPKLGHWLMSTGSTSLATPYGESPGGHEVRSEAKPQGDLTVALQTFARRPVTSVQKLEEIKTLILPFQRNADPAVRQQSSEAIILSLSEWIEYAKVHKTSTYSTRVIEILEAYLKNAFSELNSVCRHHEITLLAEQDNLRPFLCEEHTLPILLSFLNSDTIVREKTVMLLVSLIQDSRLSKHVSAVRQNLYVTIESCVVVLEHSNEVRTLIARLANLEIFTSFSVRLLNNHLSRILYAFRRRLHEDNIPDSVSLRILKTLDKILSALVNEEKTILQYHDEFVELYESVVNVLMQTPLLVLRHAAISVLRNLTQVCPIAGISDHDKYHEIIDMLGNVYTANHCTRDEFFNILELFGQLGAVDPSSNPMENQKKKAEESVTPGEVDSDLVFDCTSIVYRMLCRMLDQSMSEAVQSQTLGTLLDFIQSTQDSRNVVDGVHAVQAVLHVLKRFSDAPSLRLEALYVLGGIIALRYDRISRVMLPEIVVLLEQLWIPSDPALFRAVLEVVNALRPGELSGKEQLEVWSWLYPRLVDVAEQDHTESHEFSLYVIDIILNASYIPPHCMNIVFPMLMRFVKQADLAAEVRTQSLCAAVHIVHELKAIQFLPSLIQSISTFARHCEMHRELATQLCTPTVRESLRVLSTLQFGGRSVIKQLRQRILGAEAGIASSSTRGLARPVVGSRHQAQVIGRTGGVGYWNTTVQSSNGAASPSAHISNRPDNGTSGSANRAFLQHKHSELLRADDDTMTSSIVLGASSTYQDLGLFMKHIEYCDRVKENKLREWFAELQKWIILVTPHPAFRVLINLFDKHEQLRRELFYPSFKALYEVLSAEQIKKVSDVLTHVLNSNDADLSSKCLGLVDYFDHNPPQIASQVFDELRNLQRTDRSKLFIHATDAGSVRQNSNKHWSTWHSDPFAVNTEQLEKGPTSTSLNTVNNSKEQDMLTSKPVNIHNHDRHLETPLLLDSSMTLLNVCYDEKEHGGGARLKEGDEVEQPNEFPGLKSITGSHELSRFQKSQSHLEAEARLAGLIHGPEKCPDWDSYFVRNSHPIPNDVRLSTKTNILFSVKDIVRAAERTRMYDKALSYLEGILQFVLDIYRHREIPREVIKRTVWPLARMYSQREMQDSVVGLFKTIRYVDGDDDGFRFELLRWWEKAKQAYEKVFRVDSITPFANLALVEGYVRTLCFCAEWDKALGVVKQVCHRGWEIPASSTGNSHTSDTTSIPSTVAQCGALSAWVLGRWDDMTQLSECISTNGGSNTAIRHFLFNVVHLHSAITQGTASSYDNLRESFRQGKLLVDESLRTLMPLSYSHAYENIALLQHFTEMEETLEYTLCRSTKRRSQYLERWNRRFLSLKPDSLYANLHTLLLHSLVLNRSEMSGMMLHFCESMSAEYPRLAIWVMNWLWQGTSASHNDSKPSPIDLGDMKRKSPSIVVGYICHLWSQGHRQDAVSYMERYLTEHGRELEVKDPDCYGGAHLKLGLWKQDLHADCFWMKDYCEAVLTHFHEAIRAMPHSYEGWHSWGLLNYRIQQREHRFTLGELHNFVEAAHQGFVAAICRCKNPSEALPGIMRLLQLWVIHNGVVLLKEMVADSIGRIPVDHWVQAIPQLIGYLTNDSHDVREMISMILKSLCVKHPQAVVFPLLVVLIPDSMEINTDPQLLLKRELVQSVIRHCPKRIRNEAETMAKLLVEVSAIPIERIREHLSQVAAAWNPNAEYEDDREEAHWRLKAALEIFQANRKHLLYTVGDIGQFVHMVIDDDLHGHREKAVGIVNQLVDEITKHISEKLGSEPQKAMEPLLRLRNCSIAVFGEYNIDNVNYPTILSFSAELDVIPSKKRPRRIQLNGSDGFLYSYCLKGNEDIRMDERVMQLFGMVNILLSHMRMPIRADIHRFPVIPITSNLGLLGWVKDARTINNTICSYRATISHLRTHHESNVLQNYVKSFGQWDKLSIIQRTEALDYVISEENCQAVDIAHTIWYRANTAEQWLNLRTVYTTSLATMSLVGYVLGLGDRHLGNILLSMSTGKIVHIDFGDSFDVCRLRHVLPETVPFRLTRMLTSAMEVFGVNGVFRATATRTQSVLSQNRDSIMALLSAFVYDAIMQHRGKVKNIMDKSRSPQNIVERTRNKLRGREMALPNNRMSIYKATPESSRRPDLLYMSKAFDDNATRDQSLGMTPDEQVEFLIQEATRIDNYTTMYFGWGPLW